MEPAATRSVIPVSSLNHSGTVVTGPATHADTKTIVTTSNLPSRTASLATSAACAVPAFFVVVVSKLPTFQHRTFYEAHETLYRWAIVRVLGKQVPEEQPENSAERALDTVMDVAATVVVDVAEIAAPALPLGKLSSLGSSVESVTEIVIDGLENKFEEREDVKQTEDPSFQVSLWSCLCCRSSAGR